MNLDKKRWLILTAGILANMCQGAAYASSVFAKPMLLQLALLVPKMITGADGVKIPDPMGTMIPDMTKWALVFSINLACLPIGMLLSGKIADQKSTKLVVAIGGLVFSLGVFLAGFSTSLTILILTFGVMMGIGSGAAYGAIVAASVRWFPDKRGLASGLSVGALGIGTLAIAPIAVYIMGAAPITEVPVLFTLRVLGAAFLVIITIASILIVNPPADFIPKGFVPKKVTAKSSVGQNVIWTDMLKKNKFWLLYVLYALGAFSGLMIISQASPIAQSMTDNIRNIADEKSRAVAASVIVSFLGLFNAIGRIIWGFISDKLGRLTSIAVMFLITSVAMFLLPMLVTSSTTFIIAALFIGSCYGGYLGIFPSICADNFGVKNLALNYALLFSAFSVAAIAGPYVGAYISKTTGSYNQAFTIAGIVCAVGFILALITNKITSQKAS